LNAESRLTTVYRFR